MFTSWQSPGLDFMSRSHRISRKRGQTTSISLSLGCRHLPGALVVLQCFLNPYRVQEVKANTWIIPGYRSRSILCLLDNPEPLGRTGVASRF